MKTKLAMKAKREKLSGVSISTKLSAGLEESERNNTAEAPTAEQESGLQQRALLVRFSIGRWYGSGADEEVVSELRHAKNATGEIGSFTKRLMKREHLAEINRVTSEARRYHKLMTMPWGEVGERVLSVDAFREYKERMSKYEHEFFKAVDSFMEKYPKLVSAEQENLGDLWKASDYPDSEAMRASFRYGLAVDILPDAHDMRLNLSKEQADEIRKDIEARINKALHGAVSDIYARLAEQVQAAQERFDDPNARLQGKMFDQLQGLIALLPKLNIANDPKLTAMGRELQKELVALPVESLRKDPVARKAASAKAGALLNTIALMKGKP